MKMAAFTYHRPTSLAEALDLLATHGGDAKVLAGGQSLVPVMAMRLSTPAHIVDISRVPDLDTIDASPGEVEIGALVRQTTAENSSDVARSVPLLTKALPWIGHRAIRNRGTVCGSLAHADPAAELPAVALALGATFQLASARGRRDVAAADFFQGYLSTEAAEDELLTGVSFAAARAGHAAAVVEVARRHGDFALVGAAVGYDLDGGMIADPYLAFFGVSDTPVRVAAAEDVLRGRSPSAEAFAEAASVVSATLTPPSDDHATATYRRHVAGVLTRRGLAEASATQLGVAA